VVVEGSTLLRHAESAAGHEIPSDGPRTLNGLILEHFGDIPEAGVSFRIGDHGWKSAHPGSRGKNSPGVANTSTGRVR